MLEYRVLGPVAASRDGELIDLRRPLERRLLAVLLVNRSRWVSDEQIFHALWPHRLPANPLQSLRTSVSRLRARLGEADAIIRQGGGYQLLADGANVDADRFEALASHRAAGAGDLTVQLRDALGLWVSDEAYADFRYDDFAQAEAQRLQSMRLHAVEELAATRLARGESEVLVADLQLMVRKNPSRERLYGLLMLALYRAGRQAEALGVYQSAREYLRDELGLEPSHDLAELEVQILLHDPALAPAQAPSANNLPSRISSVVGRGATIDDLVGHLRDRRLVTVTGPAGVGKTTVATEAANVIVSEGHLEAWYVDLVPAAQADQLEPHLTDQLGLLLQQPPNLDATRSPLGQIIGMRPMLLVLDNCEHLIEETSDVVASVLRECPNLTVLATSRERLGVIGELVLPLEPLFAGDGHDDALDPEQARRTYPALELLHQRCAAASPGFALTRDDLPAALRLCRRLDGLPLALELAASQAASLSLVEIERQLDARFLVLGGQRGVTARHRTLDAAISWSYDRLDETQQECLQLVACVTGPVTISDVAHLAADGDEARAAATMAALQDKSLVRATIGVSRWTQFEMLMTVREFALSRAAQAGRISEHERRHAACFLAMAEEAGPHLLDGGPHQLHWMTRCTQSAADSLRAVRTLLAHDCIEDAIDLVANVGVAWTRYQLHLEAYPVVRDALQAAGDRVAPSTPRANVLAAWMTPDVPGRPFRGGLEHAQQARRTAAAVGDGESTLAATAFLGLNQWLRGYHEEALETVRDAYLLADRANRSWAETTAFIIAGIVVHALDPSQAASRHLERAAESARVRADEVGEAAALGYLGSALKDDGQYTRARTAFRQAHVSGRRVGDPTVAIAGAAGLALAAWLDNDPDDALLAADQALSMLSGLTPSAQDGAVRQLFLAPEPTYTLSAWEDGMNALRGMPSDAQPTAFVRLLLELAEDRARSYLDDARTGEIRIGLTRIQSHAQATSQATATH